MTAVAGAYGVTSMITGKRIATAPGKLSDALAWCYSSDSDADTEALRALRALDDALTLHPRRQRREIRRLCRYLMLTLDTL